MRFYTNVCRIGNNLCVREHTETGPSSYKIKFSPTLYVQSEGDTALKSLYGDPVKPVSFDSMSETKDFMKQYENVSGFQIFGQQNYILQFLDRTYPTGFKFDPKVISTWVLDIETRLPTDAKFNGSHKIKIRKKI